MRSARAQENVTVHQRVKCRSAQYCVPVSTGPLWALVLPLDPDWHSSKPNYCSHSEVTGIQGPCRFNKLTTVNTTQKRTENTFKNSSLYFEMHRCGIFCLMNPPYFGKQIWTQFPLVLFVRDFWSGTFSHWLVSSLFSAAEANTITFWKTVASRKTGIVKYASSAS